MSCNCASNPVLAIGRMERTNPLPVGVYWQDLIGDDAQAEFAALTLEQQGNIKVLVSEFFEADGEFESRNWVKFQVIAPFPWPQKKLGFPEVIEQGDNINSSSDTVSGTEPTSTWPDLFASECDTRCQIGRVVVVGGVVVAGVVLYAIANR